MAWLLPNASDSAKYDLYIGSQAGVIANENSSNLFFDFSNLMEINFNNNFDTSNVVDMSYMFEYMDSITLINVGTKWNTSKVTNNEKMFYGSKVSSVTTGQCF